MEQFCGFLVFIYTALYCTTRDIKSEECRLGVAEKALGVLGGGKAVEVWGEDHTIRKLELPGLVGLTLAF